MTVQTLRRKLGRASDTPAALGDRPERIEGVAKTMGATTFAADQRVPGMAHAVLVGAQIAAGRVTGIDATAAEAAPGVLLVLHAANAMRLRAAADFVGRPPAVESFCPFATDITFTGQPVAAVIAETLEQATEAARLLRIDYEEAPARATLLLAPEEAAQPLAAMDKDLGDAEAALAAAPVRIDVEYLTPREFQMPIEPHVMTAAWDGDRLTMWEPSQWLDGMARTYSEWFGVPFENVRIVSPYLGGGFGSKGFAQPTAAVPAMAAKMLGRPVRMAMTRPQTFALVGGRAATRQRLQIGATPEGRLLSIVQDGESETSMKEMWVEGLSVVTQMMYDCPNFASRQRAVRVNTVMPGAKRAPGENPSAFGIECAIDELAYATGTDPLAIRLLNYAERDVFAGKPWSTRQLREAFAAGAERFGWSRRSPAPRSMRDGRTLIGWGVAAGTYPVRRAAGEAEVSLLADGSAEVRSSTVDMGQGAYTIIAQTVSEIFGIPVDRVAVRLGDSDLPRAGVTGGSRMAMTMTAATHKAGTALKEELIALALSHPASPFREAQPNTLTVAEGRLSSPAGGGLSLTIGEFLTTIGETRLTALRDTLTEFGIPPEKRFDNYTTIAMALPPTEGDYSHHSWCAHFVEVRVDEDLGTVRVSRVVSALDSGRVFNPRLAESQWRGGIIMGIGQALLEEGVVDERHARLVNDSLGDYLLPTNADIPDIDVISVGIPDFHASPLGGKGVGELGIVGVAPAIANAVFHATGKRIRALPITLEKLIGD